MSDGARAASTAGATCLLLVADRVVLRASAPPEAEYAMFEIGEIELRASEPGRVREHGYQTTAESARKRLAHFGITAPIARELAVAMQPIISDAYARGTAARRVARYLGPLELFQSETYDAGAKAYRGVFLDVAALAGDLGLEQASTTIQALYLAALLEVEDDEASVILSTDGCTKGAKPGARTYKRPTFTETHRLLNAIGGLAHRRPTPTLDGSLPRADVIAFLRSRADAAPDEDTRGLYRSLESTVSLRDMPEKGPLAFPDLWALEARLETADLDGIIQAIDDAEREHGRTPGTTYLRSRASLSLQLEPASVIAEKVSALALSMTSFQELALLAAEAWLDAGDPRRAMPYARDLVDSLGVDEGLLLRAQRLLARAVGAAPQKAASTEIPAAAPATRPPLLEVEAEKTEPGMSLELEPPIAAALGSDELIPAPETPQPRQSRGAVIPPLAPPPRPQRPRTAPASHRMPVAPPPSEPDPFGGVPELDRTPGPIASFTLELPGPEVLAPPKPDQDAHERPTPLRPPNSRPPRGAIATPLLDAGDDDATPRPPDVDDERPRSFMHGASLPPYRHESPAPLLPKAPLLPRLSGAADELAEHLALPPGIGSEPRSLDVLPTSVLEARIQFTLLARELGLDYRLKRGVELHADLSGIEAMQSVLLESFPEHTAKTSDEAYELRRHGALLSEILARRLDAEWLDISPSELGYWVMIVPPDTRVWPFGRVARLVAMGHKERDLVSYFLELQSRARAR